MRAIILAGGKGTRLKPYTSVLPKPLMPIDHMPILEIVLRQLKYYGINHVTLSVGYLAELIQSYFRDGENLGIKIDYSRENEPLGTAGPLNLINNLGENPLLVMNGDVLTNIDYRDLVSFHITNNAEMTVATVERNVPINLGVLEINTDRIITKWEEKPKIKYNASMGIYVINPKIISKFINRKKMDVPDLIETLINRSYGIYSYEFTGRWLDIGRQDDYEMAIEEFSNNTNLYLPKHEESIDSQKNIRIL
ncbi:sugar phosphate nucleotidyltransferase [Metabacillus halosaccharovorans]|uniref:sugar phosphate nucleotidyltransferase n=1 Tax=Metabacillus halosaccharovorans TaxID=930124 RepID=UPI0020403D0C|nr:sugar phosphate nucleotidyltransferase [Metabacillus halosaccharovorans]MCM3444717.1 sugar phosphate nucleotidyltransferase [Metabacillus halosaccharovorans]